MWLIIVCAYVMYDLLSLCECACSVRLIIVCVCNVWLITVCACDVWFIIILCAYMWYVTYSCGCVWFIIVVCVWYVFGYMCHGAHVEVRGKFWGVAIICVPYLLSHLPNRLLPLCGVLLTPPYKCILEAWSLNRFFYHLLWQEKKKRETLLLMESYRMYKQLVYHLINRISRSEFLEGSASPPAFRYVSCSGSLSHTDLRNPCVLFSLQVDLARRARRQNLPSQPLPGSPHIQDAWCLCLHLSAVVLNFC